MLSFVLGLSNLKIDKSGTAKVKFSFKNNSHRTIHCLSYKFKSLRDGETIRDFSAHEFFFNISPGQEKEKEFGETQISESYLAGNTNPGEYEMQVFIRYFVCGEDEIQQVTGSINLTLLEKEVAVCQ
jgi:hypothetical protein